VSHALSELSRLLMASSPVHGRVTGFEGERVCVATAHGLVLVRGEDLRIGEAVVLKGGTALRAPQPRQSYAV